MDTQIEAPANEATEQPAAPSLTDMYTDEPKGLPTDEQPQQNAGTETDTDTENTDDNTDAVEQPEVEADPIEAPTSWAKDAKEVFAGLPREAQEIIAKREADREKFVQAKSREAANTRNAVEGEARQALSTIMQNHQQALEQFLPALPQMPDPRLLASAEHRDLYYQQKAEYDYAVAHRGQVSEQIEQARQHAQAISQHQLQAEIQAEHAVLEEALGDEWSDPSSRAKLLTDLEPIAAELGYPKEVMAEARANDIIALRRIQKAFQAEARLDQLEKQASKANKATMAHVRNAKLPPAARSGVQAGIVKPRGTLATLYPDDVPRN